MPSFASTAIVAAATTQTTPTVIWFGATQVTDDLYRQFFAVYHRLWSDGKLEMMSVRIDFGGTSCVGIEPEGCTHDWIEVPPPPAGNGFACRSDVNGDRRVDGADLAMLLGNWGDAPRHDIPPSDCPLNLINP